MRDASTVTVLYFAFLNVHLLTSVFRSTNETDGKDATVMRG